MWQKLAQSKTEELIVAEVDESEPQKPSEGEEKPDSTVPWEGEPNKTVPWEGDPKKGGKD
jgi:hypothetical protein